MQCSRFLKSYKEKSLDILSALSLENYDKVIELFQERENIIINLKNSTFSKEEMSNVIKENDLISMDDNIRTVMEKKMDDIKASVLKLKAGNKVNKNYNKNFYKEFKMFSKKV